jgi:hypothetical protein
VQPSPPTRGEGTVMATALAAPVVAPTLTQ